jgi:hypothetical protein
MKRKALAAVLGAAGLVGFAVSSHAQGSVLFDNYGSSPYYPVVYGSTGQGVSAPLAGTGALGDVSVELGYFLGTFTGSSTFTLIPSSIVPINPNLAEAPNGVGNSTTGYFQGGAVTIPGYSSGPVSFEILAFNAGYSGVEQWVEPSIAGAGLPANNFTALPGPIVLTPTPEPTTLALAGLGGLASLVALRRKQA